MSQSAIRIVTWNIKHGGSKLKWPLITDSLLDTHADLLVITEFQAKTASFLSAHFQEAGYVHQLSSHPPEKMNGIFLASKQPLTPMPQRYHPENPYRWLEAECPELGFNLLALHIPEWGSKWDKATFWREVNRYARDHLQANTILVGDFNTGLELDTTGEDFACPEYMAELVDMGWIDAWRRLHPEAREYTWRSPRHWYSMRLDYLFLSPALSNRLISAQHEHQVRLEQKLSDHSMLIIDLSQPKCAAEKN